MDMFNEMQIDTSTASEAAYSILLNVASTTGVTGTASSLTHEVNVKELTDATGTTH